MFFSAIGPRAFALASLACLIFCGPAMAYAVPSADTDGLTPLTPATSLSATQIAQSQAQPQPAPAQPAPTSPTTPASSANPPAAAAPSGEPIGNVATLTGTASVIRNQNTLPLKLKDDIYLNDVLVTFTASTLGVTFNDSTTFNLTANARITVDDYLYEDGGKNNSALFNVVNGTVAFVASGVAKTGNMKIATPTATLGIRGTTGLVEVSGGASGAHNIKLYPDPDGHVGTIDVSDRSGARLGTLTQGASGLSLRPGAGGRITAAPLSISPQQAARDQGIVRQVHAAQNVGRQVVNEQRALRQANPNRANPRGQPGPQRQNNLQQPGGERQQGQPNRAGQPQRQGQPERQGQPGAPNDAGQPGQAQQPGGAQRPANAPGVRQNALPNRPAPAPRRPPAQKPKPPKQKRR